MDTRLSLSVNSAAPANLLLSELYEFYEKFMHKFLLHLGITYVSYGLSGLALVFLSVSLIQVGSFAFIITLILSMLLIGMSIWGLVMFITVSLPKAKEQLKDFHDIESREQPIIWRLEGEEWLRYLNYIHGPDRQWRELAPHLPFCCRRSSYNRLSNRRYGHIVLFSNGVIIDKLYFISFQSLSLTSIAIFAPDQQTHGLRVHTYLKAGCYSRNIYFDVFAPSSVSVAQLQTIVQSYDMKTTAPESRGLPAAVWRTASTL